MADFIGEDLSGSLEHRLFAERDMDALEARS
jgi:hypothetical protein